MTDEKMLDQRRRLRALQDRFPSMRLLHGTELNIDPDGGVDWDEDFLGGFDLTVKASGDIESGLRHVVLVRSGQIDRHGLISQLHVLGPEDRTVRTRLEESEEVVLDRHVPIKPASARLR